MYGDALIVGYKVFVNGVVEAVLGPKQLNFSLNTGKWCREYIFQVQALSSCDGLHSKPSDPLVTMWPGVQTPHLHPTPVVDGDRVTVKWDKPEATDGVRIKLYKVLTSVLTFVYNVVLYRFVYTCTCICCSWCA